MGTHIPEEEVASELPGQHAKGWGCVNTVPAVQSYRVDKRFEQTLRLVRHALAERQLSIAGEYDIAENLAQDSGRQAIAGKLLLVDSPVLLFECLALDRAAAVFVPVHVLISADGDQTQVVCLEPSSVFEFRLPPGAAQPLEELRNWVALTLESVWQDASPDHRADGKS